MKSAGPYPVIPAGIAGTQAPSFRQGLPEPRRQGWQK